MPRTLGQMAAVAARRKHEPCAVAGCSKNRIGIAMHCEAHAKRKARYGHPEGQPIAQKDYLEESQEVATFLMNQAAHPAVISALAWLSKWLEEAREGKAEVGQKIMGRVRGRLITPEAILTEIAAVFIYSKHYPFRLPDDQRLTFAYARNVARLGTFEYRSYGPPDNRSKTMRHPSPIELRATGERIRLNLSRFLVNLSQGLNAKTEELKKFKDDLGTPFV